MLKRNATSHSGAPNLRISCADAGGGTGGGSAASLLLAAEAASAGVNVAFRAAAPSCDVPAGSASLVHALAEWVLSSAVAGATRLPPVPRSGNGDERRSSSALVAATAADDEPPPPPVTGVPARNALAAPPRIAAGVTAGESAGAIPASRLLRAWATAWTGSGIVVEREPLLKDGRREPSLELEPLPVRGDAFVRVMGRRRYEALRELFFEPVCETPSFFGASWTTKPLSRKNISRTRSPSFTITSPGRKVVRRSTEHIVLTQSRVGSQREKIQQRFMHWKFMSRITSTRRVRGICARIVSSSTARSSNAERKCWRTRSRRSRRTRRFVRYTSTFSRRERYSCTCLSRLRITVVACATMNV